MAEVETNLLEHNRVLAEKSSSGMLDHATTLDMSFKNYKYIFCNKPLTKIKGESFSTFMKDQYMDFEP